MGLNEIKQWKKVYERDLDYVLTEFSEVIESPLVLTLTGEVGAGKTTVLKSFRPHEGLISPTYSIVNESKTMAHADLYRIEKADDLAEIELELYVENKDYIFVEWGRKYARHLNKYIGEEFKYYDLEITINEDENDTSTFSRNYTLSEYIF